MYATFTAISKNNLYSNCMFTSIGAMPPYFQTNLSGQCQIDHIIAKTIKMNLNNITTLNFA